MADKTYEQRLNDRGWQKYHICGGCTGGAKHFFANPAYQNYVVRVRPLKTTFVIMLDEIIIAGPFWLYQLEEKLDLNDLPVIKSET